jgi:2,4-dienoyl-CoA reductase-like NADH-dependent reductase (Old Yellow Enzyme family)
MKLLEPVKIRNTTLCNRAVVTVHTFDFAVYNKGADTFQYVQYLQRRVEGGASLISAQNINAPMVDDKHPFPYEYLTTLFGQIATAAHNHGSAAVFRIVSVGDRTAERGQATTTTPHRLRGEGRSRSVLPHRP